MRTCKLIRGETVLFAVLGTTPSVLTETIWALAGQEVPILPDHVVILTTTVGREALCKQLFATEPDGRPCGWERLLSSLSSRGHDVKNRLRFGLSSDHIRLFPSASGQRDLADIATSEDSAKAADFMLRELRAFTENPATTVLASLAGGRKTMGALLLSCMSLLGRVQDRLLHVLVNSPFDATLNPTFLFPEKGVIHHLGTKRISSSNAHIELIDVPFVRVRGWYEGAFRTSPPGYAALVRSVQGRAPTPLMHPALTFDRAAGVLHVCGGEPLNLSPTEFAALVLLARGVHEHAALAQRLAAFSVSPTERSTPDWVSRLREGGRYSAGDVESLRKSLSSARHKLECHPQLAALAEALIPRRGLPLRYPVAKLAFTGPDVFADICG